MSLEPSPVAQAVSYPSPSGNGMESGPFYNGNARDEPQDDADPNIDQSLEDHGPEHAYEPLEQPHHDNSHGEQMPQENDANPQMPRPPNFEELQLAAQLGHGLSANSMMQPTGPGVSAEDPNLRTLLPHPEPEHQETAYMHDGDQGGAVSAQHPMPAPPPPPLLMSHIPPRKRSKVSRACDECRRKKIKCDATSDTGDRPCTSCSRLSIQCLFSRVPQKRGPSKGYIKELADRIRGIESKLQAEGGVTHDDMESLFLPEQRRTGATDDVSRKRPYSSISGGDVATPSPARQSPWNAEQRPLQPAAPYSEHDLAPAPLPISINGLHDKVAEAAPMEESMDIDEQPELDEHSLLSFLTTVQPVCPILPNSHERMSSMLAQCPPNIKTAFVYAINAVSESSPGNPELASNLLHQWERSKTNSPTTPVTVTDVVGAQTLLLLIVDASMQASSTLPFLLARAVLLAESLKMWKYTSAESVSETDSDAQLIVRIWWSLVMIDRWHAVGRSRRPLIPDASVVAPPRRADVLSGQGQQLLELSRILGNVANTLAILDSDVGLAEPTMSSILSSSLELWREHLPEHITEESYPLVHLSYWHCRLLINFLTPDRPSPEEQDALPTQKYVHLMAANADLRAPLTNHFAYLAALALSRLLRCKTTAERAAGMVKDLLDSPGIMATMAAQGLNQIADGETAEGEDGLRGLLLGGYFRAP